MQLQITIDMDNASFELDWRPEASRILNEAIGEFYHLGINQNSLILRDVNGNRVGKAELRWEGHP